MISCVQMERFSIKNIWYAFGGISLIVIQHRPSIVLMRIFMIIPSLEVVSLVESSFRNLVTIQVKMLKHHKQVVMITNLEEGHLLLLIQQEAITINKDSVLLIQTKMPKLRKLDVVVDQQHHPLPIQIKMLKGAIIINLEGLLVQAHHQVYRRVTRQDQHSHH